MNPCKEIECHRCCVGMVHYNITSREAAHIIAGDNHRAARNVNLTDVTTRIPVTNQNDYKDRVETYKITGKGGEKRVDLLIPGKCSHLVDGECDDYQNRASSCRNFKYGSSECLSLQNGPIDR